MRPNFKFNNIIRGGVMQYFFGNRSFLRGYYGVVFRPLGNVGKNKWSINFILSCDVFRGIGQFF